MIIFVKKIYYAVDFLIYYCFQLVKSNLTIAYDILSPKNLLNPGFIHYNSTIESDLGLLLLSNLISMTPGTLSVDISEDKTNILIHILHTEDTESTLGVINTIEEKIKKLTL